MTLNWVWCSVRNEGASAMKIYVVSLDFLMLRGPFLVSLLGYHYTLSPLATFYIVSESKSKKVFMDFLPFHFFYNTAIMRHFLWNQLLLHLTAFNTEIVLKRRSSAHYQSFKISFCILICLQVFTYCSVAMSFLSTRFLRLPARQLVTSARLLKKESRLYLAWLWKQALVFN